jgi:hypothetical protein
VTETSAGSKTGPVTAGSMPRRHDSENGVGGPAKNSASGCYSPLACIIHNQRAIVKDQSQIGAETAMSERGCRASTSGRFPPNAAVADE